MAHQGRREHRPWICRWPLAIRRPPSTRLARRRHVVGTMNREECLCGIDLATGRGDRGEAARLPLVVHGTGIRMRFGARPELDVRRLRSPGGTQWRRATHRSLHQSGSKVSGIRRPVSISPIPRPSMLSPLQERLRQEFRPCLRRRFLLSFAMASRTEWSGSLSLLVQTKFGNSQGAPLDSRHAGRPKVRGRGARRAGRPPNGARRRGGCSG